MTCRLGTAMALVLSLGGLLAVGCGPITEEDLQKWSHNEEGFKKMQEVVNDPEVPFDTKVRGLHVLVENGAGERVRSLVRDHEERDELVAALTEQLIEDLKGDNEDLQGKARDSLLQNLAMLTDEGRRSTQKILADWAFGDIRKDMSREEIWDKVQNRITFSQVRELEEFGIEAALIMIAKRLETKEFGVLDWLDFLQAQATEGGDKTLTDRSLAALKEAHQGLFKEMEGNSEIYFRPQELILVEKFYNIEAVLYLLTLCEHHMLDRGTQMEALMRAHELFDKIIPQEQRTRYADRLLPVMLRRLSLLNGQKRIEWAGEILARTGIPGLEKVSMYDAPEAGGDKAQKTIKLWLSRKYFNTGAFLYGVMDGYLTERIDTQAAILKQQWEKEGRWPPPAPAAAPAPDAAAGAPAPAEAPAAPPPAATAEAPAPAGTEAAAATAEAAATADAPPPAIETDPQFKAELDASLDSTLVPELQRHLQSPILLARLFGVAGLRRLGTPAALAVLESLKADKTDVDIYFLERDEAGKLVARGFVLGRLAASSVAAVLLDREFAALQVEMEQKQELPAKHLLTIRRQMMLDMGEDADALRAKYTARIEEQKQKVEAYKQRFKEELDKYQRYIKILCAKQVKEYPDPANAQAMENYIESSALVCEKDAREAL
ncbi:MAG: hypothetical protein FJ098_02005, partial [Deltaproteobacteria bacterium]|nr:hypothetical protein [Deltaproteobacteria bacterium]